MRIYLIRHGRQDSTLCNVNIGLANEGKEQARIVGKRLCNYGIDALYASNLLRAKETAELIKEELVLAGKWPADREIVIREGLREIDFGDLEGIENSQVPIVYHDFMKQRAAMTEDLSFPGGECGQQVFDRAFPILEEIVASGCERVAVVTHGGVIRSLLTGILRMDQANKLLFCKQLENCGITELLYREETKSFYVERVNDYAHMEGCSRLLRESWQ